MKTERVSAAIFLGFILGLAYLTYRVFQPFLVSLGWAVALVIFFYPLRDRLARRWRRPWAVALASSLLVTAIIIVPALLISGAFVREGIEAFRGIQDELKAGGTTVFEKIRQMPLLSRALARHPDLAAMDLESVLTKNLDRLAGSLAEQSARILRNIAVFFFDLFVTLFAMFYLFRDGAQAFARIKRVIPLDPDDRDLLLRKLHDLLYATIYSGFVVAALQGLLGGLLFWLVGISSPIFWGVVMAFFALLPLIGPWIIWLPAGTVLLLRGEVVRGIILLAVGVAVVSMVDNLLRPALIAGRAQLNGLLVFISVLGGIAVFGFLGMILGPIVVATAAAVFETYVARLEAAGEASSSH